MSTVVFQGNIRVPDDIDDLDSFCRWVCSDKAPARGRYSFLNGEVWVDMSPEQFFTHNQVKGEYAIVLGNLAKVARLGRFCPDRMLLRNDTAGLSTEPDGAFISRKTLRARRVVITQIAAGYDVLQGTPDMTLEIVSDSSEAKDTE